MDCSNVIEIQAQSGKHFKSQFREQCQELHYRIPLICSFISDLSTPEMVNSVFPKILYTTLDNPVYWKSLCMLTPGKWEIYINCKNPPGDSTGYMTTRIYSLVMTTKIYNENQD